VRRNPDWGHAALRPIAHRLALLAMIVVAFAVVACGSDEDSDSGSGGGGDTAAASSGVEEARSKVAEAESAISEWKAPGPVFDASGASGKTAWFITQQQSIPYNQAVIDGFNEAAKEAGVTVRVANGKGQVANYGRLVEQAINQDADVIVIHGIPSSLVEPQLEKAGEAGIEVITANTHDPGPPAADEPDAVVAEATHCFSCAGRLMADFMVADSDGKANAVVLTSSDVGLISSQEAAGIQEETKRLCPDCKIKEIDVPIAQWQGLTARVPSILREDPSIDYVLPLYDGMAPLIVPGIKQARAQDRVKLVSFNGTKAVLEMLEQGDVVAADVGQPTQYEGWGMFDQALRVLSGAEPVEDINVPLRLFTTNNIGDIDLSAPEESWYLEVDFREKYKELWSGDQS
jgi:ribose transport system substrate-binding protein